MEYKPTRKTLDALQDLLTKIEAKQIALNIYREFNDKNTLPYLAHNLKVTRDEITEMEFEFRELVLKLRS